MEIFPFLTPPTLGSPGYTVYSNNYSDVQWISKSDIQL